MNTTEVTLKREARESIVALEKAIKETEGCVVGTGSDRYPLKHSFSDGIYVREIFIPEGDLIVGQIHKHEHPNFLMSGTVRMFTEEGGTETIVGPCSMISSPGTKRSLFAETDLVWITVHNNPTNIKDIPELEASIAVSSYKEYDDYKNNKNTLTYKLRKRLIKILEV